MMPKYPLAERFKAPQGEGLYTGTPMAFIRTVGCSVGQSVCTACDTNFSRQQPELGGGSYTVDELLAWAGNYRRIVLTGGEPLDRDLRPLINVASDRGYTCHVETSGTKDPNWLDYYEEQGGHQHTIDGRDVRMWVTVSPKPGYLHSMIAQADEVKVIVGGLGDGPGWPTVEDAARWADAGQLVYIQPRNFEKVVDEANLEAVLKLTEKYPQLRVSCQLHKFLGVR